jgi:hypothetical protein
VQVTTGAATLEKGKKQKEVMKFWQLQGERLKRK